MTKRTTIILIAASALLLAGGCSPGMSNGQKFIIACDTYATTANTVAILVKAGEFGTTEKAKIKVLNDEAIKILSEMRADLVAGNTTFDFPYALTKFQTILDDLLQMQLAAEAAKQTKEKANGGNGNSDRGTGVGDNQHLDPVPADGPGTLTGTGGSIVPQGPGGARQPGPSLEGQPLTSILLPPEPQKEVEFD